LAPFHERGRGDADRKRTAPAHDDSAAAPPAPPPPDPAGQRRFLQPGKLRHATKSGPELAQFELKTEPRQTALTPRQRPVGF